MPATARASNRYSFFMSDSDLPVFRSKMIIIRLDLFALTVFDRDQAAERIVLVGGFTSRRIGHRGHPHQRDVCRRGDVPLLAAGSQAVERRKKAKKTRVKRKKK